MSGLSVSSASVPKELKSEIRPAVASGDSTTWSVHVSVWSVARWLKMKTPSAAVIAATGIVTGSDPAGFGATVGLSTPAVLLYRTTPIAPACCALRALL